MATTYGPEERRLSVGIDVTMSPTSITKSTASVTLTWKVYARATYAFNDLQTMKMSNTLSATTNYTMVSKNYETTVKLVGTYTQTISTSYTGTVTRTLTAAASGLFNGGTPAHTRSITIPKRPPQSPAAPLTATVSRTSDTAFVVSLTAPASWDDAATKWDNVIIQRSADGGSYISVATLGASSRSWTDTSTRANHQYRYRVYSRNISGSSASVYTDTLQTTPAAPTSVSAVKSGSNIVITFTDNSPANSHFEIRDNGVLIATVPNASASPYTHVDPDPGITHTYTVRAKTANPVLYSPYGVSNTVQLQAPPNAPTNLDPNGESVDAAEGTVLTWSHNPVDTTAQTQFELLHRLAGSDSWTNAGVVTSGTSSYTISAGTYPSGSQVEWRVRTRGAHDTFSPWSAVATFKLISRPVVTIISPTGPGYDSSVLEVDWTYFQAEDLPQVSWTVVVTNLDTGATVRTVSGNNATTIWNSATPLLKDGTNYRIAVTARVSGGLASVPDTIDILVEFEPPTLPLVTAEWNECSGYNEVTMKATGIGEESRRNLVKNPTAEINASLWYYGFTKTTITRDATTSDGGTASIRGEALTDNGMEVMCLPGIEQGKTYTIMARVKASKPIMKVALGEYFGSTTVVTVTDVWTTVTATFVGGITNQVVGFTNGDGFDANRPLPGDYLWIDWMIISEGESIPSYFDGSTGVNAEEYYEWAGDPHASESIASRIVDPASGGVPPRTNYLSNPSFETSTAGWNPGVNDTITRVAVGATSPAGNYVGQIGGTDASQSYAHNGFTVPTVPGEVWTFSASLYGSGSGRVSIEFGDSTPARINGYTVVGPTVNLSTTWQRTSATATAPAGAAYVRVFVTDLGTSPDNTFYFDAALLEKSGGLSGYFDGDTPDTDTTIYSWTGTPHASASTATLKIAPETVEMMLERSVDGGPWENLGTFPGKGTTHLDWTAPVVGRVVYRATSVTALPSSASTEFALDIEPEMCDRPVYISGGPSFALVARLESIDTHSVTVGRQRALNQYAGRTSPVESSGLVVDTAVSVKAKFLPEQECDGCARVSRNDVEQIFSLAGPHLYRDSEGRTMYAFLSPASIDYTYLGDLSFTATRASGGTPAQLAAISAFNGPVVVESPPGEYRIIGGETIEELPAEWTWSP